MVVDVMTLLVTGGTKGSLSTLVKACVENEEHAMVVMV
jgi:hypothetical protein